jgi:hypothetical protein
LTALVGGADSAAPAAVDRIILGINAECLFLFALPDLTFEEAG